MSLCVLCTTTCKHFTSSLKINASNSIFQLVHNPNILMLIVLTPLHLPYMPSNDYAHLFVDYINSSVAYDNTSADYTNKSNDCTNTPDDLANISTDSVNTLDKSF